MKLITYYGTTFLACGSIDMEPGFTALVYFIIGLWVVALALFPINFFLIFSKSNRSFKSVNAQILGVYTILAAVLFFGFNSLAQDRVGFFIGCALVFLIPFTVIVHFICLLVARRRRKRRLEAASVSDAKEKQNES
jgi:amino acid transporter